MKKILIAIPTAKNIEAQTFLSIYNLIKPVGYQVDFQYFYGYNIDQVRNLIANYTVRNNYDYLFCVDSDMDLESDTLVKLLSADKEIIGGIYRQRNLNAIIPEVYFLTLNYGSRNANTEEINLIGDQVIPVDSIGFGCVLIKKEVLEKMEYPHFLYKHSIDFKDTVSEDTYFCRKARETLGIMTYCHGGVRPGHIGSFTINLPR